MEIEGFNRSKFHLNVHEDVISYSWRSYLISTFVCLFILFLGVFWLIRSILIKGGWWNTKELLNLEWVVNKWKWVVVSPKIWCCPPPSTIRLSRVGGSFLENICDHTVMPQILWSAKYENQNFEKIFPFHRAYKNNLKNAKESLLLKCTQIKI